MAGFNDPWSSGNTSTGGHGEATYGGGDVPGYKAPTTWPGQAAPDPGATPAGKAAAAGQPAPQPVVPANEPKHPSAAGTPEDLTSYMGSLLGDFADAPMLSDDGKTRVTATDLAASIYKRPADEINRIQGMLFRAGYYPSGAKWGDVAKGQVDDGTLKAWATMLKQTAAQGSANPNKGWKNVLTDMAKSGGEGGTGPTSKTDIAKQVTDAWEHNNVTERSHDYQLSLTTEHSHTSDTQTDVKFSDPVTAHALVVKAMQDKLGRDPSAAELGTFRDALHQYEAANPTITKTDKDATTTSKEATTTDAIQTTKEDTHKTGSATSKTTTTTPGQAADNSIPSTLGSTQFPSGDTAPSTEGDMGLGAAFQGLKSLPDADVKSGNFKSTNGASTEPGTTSNESVSSNSNTDTNRDINSSKTSNTVRDNNTVSSQNSTQSGGTDPADWAQFYVQEQNRPEMDEYHKGTMYYNAAMSVLGLGGSHG